MITKEQALAIARKETLSNYPLDSCEEYPKIWLFFPSTAPEHVGGPDDPVMISRTTGKAYFGFPAFVELVSSPEPSHAYTIDTQGTFHEVPIDYWDDEDEDEEDDEARMIPKSRKLFVF